MSVNPDKVIETKQLVAGIEQKLILEGMRRCGRITVIRVSSSPLAK